MSSQLTPVIFQDSIIDHPSQRLEGHEAVHNSVKYGYNEMMWVANFGKIRSNK